jgi:hypothetical protein
VNITSGPTWIPTPSQFESNAYSDFYYGPLHYSNYYVISVVTSCYTSISHPVHHFRDVIAQNDVAICHGMSMSQ